MIAFPSLRIQWLPKPGSLTRSFRTRFPRVYLGFATLIALAGHAYLLLFPILFLTGLIRIYDSILATETIAWQAVLIWTLTAVVAGLVSYRSIQIKVPFPVGLTLTEDKAPELYSLVQLHRSHFRRPAIHRIVITGRYELDIIRTPRWVVPVWMSNTLVIGLPVLQGLSPKQFECMLARRIGQHSRKYNLLTNWLYQLRVIWQQYRICYGRQKGFGTEPLRWFFAAYTPFYNVVSAQAARQDEYNADTYAMELYNDEEVREMITADSLCRWYLQKQFWPAIYKIAAADSKSAAAPHAKMAAAIHAGIKGDKRKSLMAALIAHKPSNGDTIPSLLSRIENIGHNKVRRVHFTTDTAAVRYLGDSKDSVIALFDKLWQKSYLARRKRPRRQKQDQKAPTQSSSG